MLNELSALNVTQEMPRNPHNNEFMAHVFLKNDTIQEKVGDMDGEMDVFSIHEGELALEMAERDLS